MRAMRPSERSAAVRLLPSMADIWLVAEPPQQMSATSVPPRSASTTGVAQVVANGSCWWLESTKSTANRSAAWET